MALLNATGINIPQISELGAAFRNIGGQGVSGINGIYGNAKTQTASDASARGMAPSSYAASRLGTQQGLDTGDLESSLGSGLGNAVYGNAIGARDYNQQSELANETAALNRPSTLQQIFQGIGAVGKPAAQLAGMYGGSGGSGASGGTLPAGSPLGLEGGYGGGSGSQWGYGYPTNPFGGY